MALGTLKYSKRGTLPQNSSQCALLKSVHLEWDLNAACSFVSVLNMLLEKTNFFPSHLSPPPKLNTEFSEHLQYPQMGVHRIPTILLRPGFNRTFIQSDQVWPDQQLWNRFICEPLWDEFPGLDFCGNGPAGNAATSFTAFSSLGSPPETKVCYHLYSAIADTELIFKERKWWIPLNTWR